MREYDTVDETTADDGTPFRVVIEYDQDSYDLNPRENDCPAGRIVALDTRDRSKWRPREDGDDPYSRANAASIVDAIQDHSFPVVSRWLRIFHGATVVLPLYEGTDGLSAGRPDDTAEADEYRGITFDTPTTRKNAGPMVREDMEVALTIDVDIWATWARGEVFGWIVQRGEVDEDGVTVWDEDSNEESVWSHIGEDWAREAARIGLDDFMSQYNTDHPGNDEDDEAQWGELGALVVSR